MQNVNSHQQNNLIAATFKLMLNKFILLIVLSTFNVKLITAQCPANLTVSNGNTGFWTNTSGGIATVKITAVGGGGGKNLIPDGYGSVTTLSGGSGATMIGTFTVPAGSTLFAIAGQAGTSFSTAGGGGGGSGVVMCSNTSSCASGTILILAGGGGGTSGYAHGMGGQIAQGNGNAGTNSGRNGAGGGGLNGNGQTGNNTNATTGNNYPATGGGQVNKTAISLGGAAGFNNGVHMGASGGNGMAGGGATDGGSYGGGGGGYTGGNGENDTNTASGGGSFNSGTSQTNTNGTTGGGSNAGSVLIECISVQGGCITPIAYNVTGTGSYCSGGIGVAAGLSNSESGITYQLKNGATDVGVPVNGTGSAISFGNQTAGTYTVVATRTTGGCTATMTGNAVVTANAAPTASITVTNNCGNAVLNLTTNATSFAWSNGQITEDITVSNSNNYTVTVTGSNSCTATANANAAPNPIPTIYAISGGGTYCSGISSSFSINLSDSELSVNYQLKSGINNIGNAVSGTGSSLNLGSHSIAGSYTVVATHSSGGCTASMTGTATIVVNDCIHSGVNLCETFTLNNVTGNSWFNIYNTTGGIIASVNPNGNNLGTVTAKIIDPAGTYVYSSTYYLGRYIEISSSNYPNGSIIPSDYSMRVYYNNVEFNEYKANANTPSATIQDLNVAWASGGTGCDFSNYVSTSNLQGIINNSNVTSANYGTGNIGFYLQFNLNHLTMFLATTNSANVLPIELGDFRGFVEKNANVLNWLTFTENNNKGFEIERSNDAIQFEKIGFIVGKGNSVKTQTYRFIDYSPKQGINYYRLKQIDFDGSFLFSKSIAINQANRTEVIVSPNPSNDIFSLSAYDGLDFSIYNIFGQLLDVKVQNGKLDLSNYPPNIYFLEVFDKNQSIQVAKLIKE